MKYKIAKIGWQDENDIIPVVLLSKKERDKIGVIAGKPVKVFQKSAQAEIGCVAVVQKQFSEFVGEQKLCTVNSQLANKLNLTLDSKVEITKELLESEYKQFVKDSAQHVFFGF